jgi:nucleoside-diphosphate kinase
MSGIRTFTMLKPDAVEKGHVGAILEQIASAGFRIVAMKLMQRRFTLCTKSVHFSENW